MTEDVSRADPARNSRPPPARAAARSSPAPRRAILWCFSYGGARSPRPRPLAMTEGHRSSLECGLPDLAPRCRITGIILILLDNFTLRRRDAARVRAPMLPAIAVPACAVVF